MKYLTPVLLTALVVCLCIEKHHIEHTHKDSKVKIVKVKKEFSN